MVVSYFSAAPGRSFPFTFAMDRERHDVSGRSIVSVNESNAYVAAGLAGLGIIQAPTFAVQQHISAGALKPVLVNWTTEPLPLYVVFPPTKHLSNRLRVFVIGSQTCLPATPSCDGTRDVAHRKRTNPAITRSPFTTK